MAVDSDVTDFGPAGPDEQEGDCELALVHEHLPGRRGQRAQLRGERHERSGGAAGEDLQCREFVGADVGQAGHVTRLRRRDRGEQAGYGAAYTPLPVMSGRSSVVLMPGGAAITVGMEFTIRPAAATIAAWL